MKKAFFKWKMLNFYEINAVLSFESLKKLAHNWPMGWQAKKIWLEPILGQLCFGPQWAGPKPSQITLKARAGSSWASPWPDTTLVLYQDLIQSSLLMKRNKNY